MTKQKQRRSSPSEKYILLGLILGGIVLFVLTLGLSFRHQKKAIEREVSSTLNLAKTTCQKYLDYEMGITTKDLQDMINKINVLKYYTKEEEKAELLEQAENQYLSGVILLDENLQVAENVKLDKAENETFLKLILEDSQVKEVLQFPEKVFADSVEVDGKSYEYAIASRVDESGIIICYYDTTKFQDDKYEISLSNLLDNLVQNKNEVLVVTDGENVISSSEEKLEGLSISECPISSVLKNDQTPEDENLIELKSEGKTWFGKHDMYRNYYLYVFFRAQKIYPRMLLTLGIAAGLYLIFALVVLLFVQSQKREKMDRMEKEFHLVQAISSIYDVNLILYPKENTWEPVVETSQLKK